MPYCPALRLLQRGIRTVRRATPSGERGVTPVHDRKPTRSLSHEAGGLGSAGRAQTLPTHNFLLLSERKDKLIQAGISM